MERLQSFNGVIPFGNEIDIPLNGQVNAVSNGMYLCVRKVLEEGVDFWDWKVPETNAPTFSEETFFNGLEASLRENGSTPAPAEVNNVDTLINEAPRTFVEEVSNGEEQ